MKKVNTIDLFAGCGGLTEGFEQSGHYKMLSGVEWDKAPIDCLRHRMETKWGMKDAADRILRFDMQRSDELINGWHDDPAYGSSKGVQYYVEQSGGHVDLIIGGPPCQAYSIAGRVRDENGMRNDYRNYLFESYLAIVNQYRPKAFLFENVPGLLSAKPGDGSFRIVERIQQEFLKSGYYVLDDLSNAVIDMTEYGVPQRRSRIIILGINSDCYSEAEAEALLHDFYYSVLPKYKESTQTVKDAIGDLPALYPLPDGEVIKANRKKYSHTLNPDDSLMNHEPRFANERDIKTFKLLTEDIEKGEYKYVSTDALKELYTKVTGRESNVHKFYVLRWDEPSNLIPAHLYKDGLRHIHPDSKQARTITVREAARLQTFPDDFEFVSHSNLDYKMIGNAVPPKFARKMADALYELIYKEG
jgi:DNA (cytosine-5)-methyltransferase 1